MDCILSSGIWKNFKFFLRSCLFTKKMTMTLRTSTSSVFGRLSFAPPTTHLLIVWRVVSMSVRYSKFLWSWCVSRDSQRTTTSGVVWTVGDHVFLLVSHFMWLLYSLFRQMGGGKWLPVSHRNDFRLEEPVLIECDATSHDPSPVVHVPSKWRDSVPSQYVCFGPVRLTV